MKNLIKMTCLLAIIILATVACNQNEKACKDKKNCKKECSTQNNEVESDSIVVKSCCKQKEESSIDKSTTVELIND